MFGFHADAPPLIDGIDAGRNERLIDGAIDEFDFEVGLARLLQQAPSLGARLLDVAPKAGELFELRHRQRPGGAWPECAANALDQRDLAEESWAAPPVDCQRECVADAQVVERLALRIEGKEDVRHPWPLL